MWLLFSNSEDVVNKTLHPRSNAVVRNEGNAESGRFLYCCLWLKSEESDERKMRRKTDKDKWWNKEERGVILIPLLCYETRETYLTRGMKCPCFHVDACDWKSVLRVHFF